MDLSEMLGGESWWTLNMAALEVVGAPSSRQVRLGWRYGKTSGNAGFRSLISLDLSLGMTPRSVFGMICGVETTLKVAFPALFGIACLKDTVVADNLELLGDSFQWNVSFIREAHDWEVDVFAYFFQLLLSVKVNRDNEDSLWWVPSKKGVFKVKSFFYSLTSAGSNRFP
jgi:hypothetical protein